MVLWLALSPARAEPPPVHDPARPLALGNRAGVWSGPYNAPSLGGHVKVRASRALGLTGFSDNTLRIRDGVARHDHVLGFAAYTPLLGSDRAYVSPTIGSCVDFRLDSPLTERLTRKTDVLFGTHAGLTGEVALGRGWSLEANAMATAYFGNSRGGADWTAHASPGIHTTFAGQLLAGLNYTL